MVRTMEAFVSRRSAFIAPLPLLGTSRRFHAANNVLPSGRPARYHSPNVTRAVLGVPPGPVGSNESYSQMVTGAALRSLLTKRAVATVAYYLMEMNDSPTRNWLLQFEDFAKRCDENRWEDDGTFLHNMLRAKPVKCTMNVGHPRGRFKREFKFEIVPMQIAQRILAVRLQLAKEWAHDLQCVALENQEITRMSLERVIHSDEVSLTAAKKNVFDFDNLEANQTPLRFKNYGKLKMYVTQHAISRFELLLRDTSNHDYMFFRTFRRHMEPLSNDEEFIVGLRNQLPASRINPVHEINPKDLAQMLMDLRVEVAQECISVLKGIEAEQKLDERRRLEVSLSLMTMGEDRDSTLDLRNEEVKDVESKGVEGEAKSSVDGRSSLSE